MSWLNYSSIKIFIACIPRKQQVKILIALIKLFLILLQCVSTNTIDSALLIVDIHLSLLQIPVFLLPYDIIITPTRCQSLISKQF